MSVLARYINYTPTLVKKKNQHPRYIRYTHKLYKTSKEEEEEEQIQYYIRKRETQTLLKQQQRTHAKKRKLIASEGYCFMCTIHRIENSAAIIKLAKGKETDHTQRDFFARRRKKKKRSEKTHVSKAAAVPPPIPYNITPSISRALLTYTIQSCPHVFFHNN